MMMMMRAECARIACGRNPGRVLGSCTDRQSLRMRSVSVFRLLRRRSAVLERRTDEANWAANRSRTTTCRTTALAWEDDPTRRRIESGCRAIGKRNCATAAEMADCKDEVGEQSCAKLDIPIERDWTTMTSLPVRTKLWPTSVHLMHRSLRTTTKSCRWSLNRKRRRWPANTGRPPPACRRMSLVWTVTVKVISSRNTKCTHTHTHAHQTMKQCCGCKCHRNVSEPQAKQVSGFIYGRK